MPDARRTTPDVGQHARPTTVRSVVGSSGGNTMLRRLTQALVRIVLATALAVIIIVLPAPDGLLPGLSNLQVPIVVFVLVCYIGKTLYDTLFYNHYWP